MTDHNERWQRVANAVNARIAHLGVDQATVARTATLSDAFVRSMMKGEPRGEPRPANLAKLGKALGWPVDWHDTILAGGDPVEIAPNVRQPEVVDELLRRVEALELMVTDQVERAATLEEKIDRDVAEWNARLAAVERRVG